MRPAVPGRSIFCDISTIATASGPRSCSEKRIFNDNDQKRREMRGSCRSELRSPRRNVADKYGSRGPNRARAGLHGTRGG